ncbi:hypothetical protein [Thermomonospora umbrina]|uniref:Mce-associated membrane protein n=1 Tax=Thermomonospora umbrina TaxID=111806 RepID=A0A3D9SPB8_9ACTN|nr:hypothetical protein [Thermomonospora umbrina]REE97816.1 Mce-associated membrane protein [Thermomonospora umbrina]
MVAQSVSAAGARLGRPVALGAITVVLGGFGFWAYQQASDLSDSPAGRNAALADNARTSEVKGQVTEVVNTAFSYNYADIPKTERAVKDMLTGKAVAQYTTMFAEVRRAAPEQKLVLTTTVTDSAVTSLQGDRARLLVFADQRNTRTTDGKTSYDGAMLAVDAVHEGGRWKISNIDTFGGS